MDVKWGLVAALGLVLVSCLSPLVAAQDSADCKDSPLVTRFPGSEIRTCEDKEFNSVDMPVGSGTKTVEGEYHNWDYAAREGTSSVQVFRNFQAALKTAGFTVDFTDSPNRIVGHKGGAWIMIEFPGDHYYQTIVITKDLQQEVTADAASLADAISKTGRVAVYGINFDTGKADISPDSQAILQEILRVLVQNPSWNLRIEGHTDSTGTPGENQSLSEKRAQSVAAWLSAQGVPASRLSAAGYGQTKPVADNTSAEGRAKNRRVELVKQ